ncbi:MAG TPA: hypothetical protein PK597_00875 [Oscillospiraceae bacterium]|nr:hypothetical protein [Oscillospiraceae bacterium]
MDERGSSPAGIGLVTIFMILIVLTLFTFSALTLSSARADLRLARISAEAVSAYYTADGEAQRLYRAFLQSDAASLEESIPITESQSLRLSLVREADGGVRILAWQTVSTEDAGWADETLPVWND